MVPVTESEAMRPEKISSSALTMSHCMVAAMIGLSYSDYAASARVSAFLRASSMVPTM